MRFPCSLGPSPRQPTVIWSRRDEPAADHASRAKLSRFTSSVSTSNSSIVLALFAIVDNVFHLGSMTGFFLQLLAQVG